MTPPASGPASAAPLERGMTPRAPGADSLPPLERGILLAVLYSDLFDYPLTADELYRYAMARCPERATFDRALEGLEGPYLSRVDEYVCRRGREPIVALRRRRRALAAGRWRAARRFASWLARVPFVRMVAVCGSQAVENGDAEADVDLFLITEPGRLWIVQAIAMVLRRGGRFLGVELCPNTLLALDRLEIEDRDLYAAREIVQSVPLCGADVHARFLDANAWVYRLLPQALPATRSCFALPTSRPRSTRIAERLLGGRAGETLDRVLYRALVAYYRLRLRRPRAEIERAYRPDRQMVVTRGYAAAVARRFLDRGEENFGFSREMLRQRFYGDPATAIAIGTTSETPETATAIAPGETTTATAMAPETLREPKPDPLYAELLDRRYGAEENPPLTPPPPVPPFEKGGLGGIFPGLQDRILFGQSYYLRFDPKLWQAMQPYPPLGTLIAAAALRERGYDVAVFDAMLARSETEWEAALDRHRPRYAVLYEDSFNYLSKMCLLRMREAAFRMIDAARRRGATVLVCGSDATDQAPAYLDAGAHAVLHGEGEATLVELMDALAGRTETPLQDIAGLSLGPELAGGDTVRTPPRPVLRELDALPHAARDLVDLDRYRALWRKRHGYFSLNLVTTRGCPFHCNWCAKPIWGQTYHSRSPADVARELAEVKSLYRPDHVWFCDDILGLKRGWMAELAGELETRALRIPFKALSRADLLLRPGEIEAFARAGCRTLWIGAESGSQKILDAMDKGTTVEQIREAAARLRAAGIEVGFFLQFGYPGETRDDVEATRALVRDCRPDEIGISVSYPLPGTRFHELVRAELGEQRNWVDSADMAMMYRGPFTTAFYRRLWRVVNKEFRARRAADTLRALARRPASLRPAHLRRAAAWGLHRLTLPVEEYLLERASKLPHDGIGPLASGLSPADAARPTPQGGP